MCTVLLLPRGRLGLRLELMMLRLSGSGLGDHAKDGLSNLRGQ